METVKLMIELPKGVYERCTEGKYGGSVSVFMRIVDAILNGTIITECKAKDCISRQAVLQRLNTKTHEYGKGLGSRQEWIKLIKSTPPVYPKSDKPSGKWIANAPQYDMLNPQYICSECGNAHTRITPYCEMCGAKMIEPQESEG